MARFQKTRVHYISAVLFLLALYAVAGLCYALWAHSDESATAWAVIAVGALIASLAHQAWVAKKRRRAP